MTSHAEVTGPRVAIVGGGLAGLAAAVALVERNFQVELFEARRVLGGRAGSFMDRTSGILIDHCQHVAMGCCTNFLDFCRRTGILDLFIRETSLHFFDEHGRRSDFCPSRRLPAPLHLVIPLLRLKHLSPSDKIGIVRAMLRLSRTPSSDDATSPTVLAWLQDQGQSTAAIERFWKVVLVSALGESLDQASLAAARKVFLDGFLAHPQASHLFLPRVSLGELYDGRVAVWLQSRGAAIHLSSPVANVEERSLRLSDGSERSFDFVILAVTWRRIALLLTANLRAAIDPGDHFAAIAAAPISSVHLWFDQAITDLPHAILIGRLSQWIFAKQSKPSHDHYYQVPMVGRGSPDPALDIDRRSPSRDRPQHYYQVVISASHELAGRERRSIVEEVLTDLRSVFPAAHAAQLLRWQLVTEHEAVFSARPGLDAIRPAQQTPVPSVLLAGDWTATGWPATMESAVRSGYLAAEAILNQLARPAQIVVPDLPRGWLANLIYSTNSSP